LAYFGRSQTKLVWSRQRFQICTSSFAVKYETCRIFSILAFSVLEDESKWHYSEKWEGYCVVHREENVQSDKWGYLSANMACLVVVDQELISNTSVYVYYFVLDAKNKTFDICDSGIGLLRFKILSTICELFQILGNSSGSWRFCYGMTQFCQRKFCVRSSTK